MTRHNSIVTNIQTKKNSALKWSAETTAGWVGVGGGEGGGLTLVLLNPDMSCLCKQCRSRSVGF